MAKPPDFSAETVRTLAARSANICNNPDCATLTVGPSDAIAGLQIKLGEAAHIFAARDPGARFDTSMTDKERADIQNGIWLCANCHTMIDKNKGVDFEPDVLKNWKIQHEGIISSLLRTHRSPLPMLRKFTDEGSVAQESVDIMETHGALFVGMHLENDGYVVESIEQLRTKIGKLPRKVKYDIQLKELLKDLENELRVFMNNTSNFPNTIPTELQTLRSRVGIILLRLRDQFGCTIRNNLAQIVP